MKLLLHESVHRNDISIHILEELETLLFASERKEAQEIEDGVVALGIGKPRRVLEEEQRLLGVECERLLEFDRVLVRGVEYRIETYHEDTLSDNSTALTWNETFVTISNIIVVERPRLVDYSLISLMLSTLCATLTILLNSQDTRNTPAFIPKPYVYLPSK